MTIHTKHYDRMLRLPEVETTSGLKRSTIYKKIKEAAFPPPVKLTERSSASRESEIQEWIGNLEVSDCVR